MPEGRRISLVAPLALPLVCLGCQPGSSIAGYVIVTQKGNLSAQEQRTSIATCPAGKKVLGGGVGGSETSLDIFDCRPLDDGTGWQATVKSAWVLPSSIKFDVYAVCASIP